MSSPKHPRRAIRAATLIAGLLALAAQAAEPPKPAAKNKSSKSLLLDREELRACLATKDRMQQLRGDIARLQSELEAEKGELKQSGEQLKEQLAALDRNNVEMVEKHVEANNAREKRIDAYEAKAASHDAKVEALRTDKASYAKNCERKHFEEADEMAIKKGK
jgi:hypothetical protein